jgi:nucleotide-binding universal stress UspA family protein
VISKILVGYDGTNSAERALEFGLDLTERFGAEVVIVNVFELPVYGAPDDRFAVTEGLSGLVKDLRAAHEGILSKGAQKAAQLKPNLKVATQLLEGNPAEQIVDAVKKSGFDLVVVGHGGESRVREMFLGGTSERVAHSANCAVLIVK